MPQENPSWDAREERGSITGLPRTRPSNSPVKKKRCAPRRPSVGTAAAFTV